MAHKGSNSPSIVACIPAYNEENHIASVLLKTQKYVDKIIVCNDGSQDLTGPIAENLGAIVINHIENRGYGASLQDLFDHAKKIDADIIVTLDADGQHNPDDIPVLINYLVQNQSDIVIGSRLMTAKSSEKIPIWRRKGVEVISTLTSNSNSYISDAQSGFRAYTRKALDSLVLIEEGMGLSTEIIMKAQVNGLTIHEVPIVVNYENNTPSQNSIFQGLEVLLSTLKYVSIRKPLIFYGLPGLGSLLVSFVFWIWTFRIFAETNRVVTNITLVAIGTSIIGLSLVTTAIILWVIISVILEAMKKR